MSIQYSLPGNILKVRLFMHLNNVCTFNHVIKFCELLISGQKLVEQSINIAPDDSNLMSDLLKECDAVFEQIKAVIAKVSVEVINRKLSEVFCNKKFMDEANLPLFLLQIENCDSLEYLEKLINYIDQMVKLYWTSKLFYSCFDDFADPAKDITELNRFVHCAAFKHVMIVLHIFLQLTLDNVEISTKEKIRCRGLILETVDLIHKYVKWDVSFQFLKLRYVLKMRSCVQCILDLFAECPMVYAQLDKIDACKNIYDYLIEIKSKLLPLKNDNKIHNYWSESDSGVDSDEEVKVKVPKSHTWWKK